MTNTGIIGLLLVIMNVAFSYKGFTNELFFEGYLFRVDKILVNRDYKRLISSGFLHVGWLHLIFNMIALLLFSSSVEALVGAGQFLVIYFAGLLGGNLLSLFIHRHHDDYSAVGASGAVAGVIFATIALFPGVGIGIPFIGISMPGWLFGLLYVLYSIYGIRSRKDNIGHDAHLGGALIGMLTLVLLQPSAFIENYTTILIILVPSLVFIYFIIRRPEILLIDNFFFKKHQTFQSIDHRYNVAKKEKQDEIDCLLDKISKKGYSGLTKEEKEKLHQYSKTIN
ncbi:MAG: rhomboid family intramembrane serine protease [Chitinophagaceae bacterium]